MNMKDAVVKIDKELERKIEKLIKNNKFLYTSKKQVVNLAIIEFLKFHSFRKEGKEELKRNKTLNKRKKRGKNHEK